MSWRASAEQQLQRSWQRRGLLAISMQPLAALVGLVVQLRRSLYNAGVLRSHAVAAPVVVIGNLFVGGTGKTPVVMALVAALAARGWRPGVVSRGYGARENAVRRVLPGSSADEVGDEPLLIARNTGVPVVVGQDRVGACALLLQQTDCNLIIADDGLQHLQLQRDVEIAVFDERGLGNGWLLPAGPLREPVARLGGVDALAVRGSAPLPPVAPRFNISTRLAKLRPLAGGEEIEIADLAREQKADGMRIVAVAGIGNPEKFFSMLRDANLRIEEKPLADHANFDADSFVQVVADRILMTEKDAVKCAAIAALRQDLRLWVVPLVTTLDPRLVDLVEARLQRFDKENSRGPSTA